MRELLKISHEMISSSPVFIIGEARSGTSILYRTLQKHSAFRPKRIDLSETHIVELVKRTFLFRSNYPDSLLRYMLYDAISYREFLRTIRPIRALSLINLVPNIMVKTPGKGLWHLNQGSFLLRSYFFHAKRARNCGRIVEKTPTNTRHMEQLSAAFPHSRLLYIHRHPVDVFSSYRRRARDDPDARWADIEIEQFCRTYEDSLQRVLRWRESGRSNLMLVRYESFTHDPAESFARICRFVGEPFEETAVQESEPRLGRWRGDPHLWGEIITTTKDWRSFVNRDEALHVESRLSRAMDLLGYETYVR